MMQQSGLLVSCEDEVPRLSETVRQRLALPLSVAAVLRSYKGFDGHRYRGEEWPPFDGAPVGFEHLDELRAFRDRIAQTRRCRIIYLDVIEEQDAQKCETLAYEFCGYDFGVCTSEYSRFSVILNEVVFGLCAEMTALARLLNSQILMPSLDAVRLLSATRDKCVENGMAKSGLLETMDEDSRNVAMGVYLVE